MGNHQTGPKRQHRPSESVGFNKQETDDDHLVTIQKRAQRISTKSAPPLDEINTKIDPDDCKLIDFSIPAMPFDTHACVTGTFTDWNEYKMTKSDGEYQAHIPVSHGCHYYQILVNGRQRFVPNETVEYHSKFGRVHFLYVNTSDANGTACFDRTILSVHTSHIWSQDINNQLISIDQSPPPRMPPHLLNILLNHKLPAHCDPNVLPEPNSVMLQHLYALSIQNGIMILSSTVRYKRKFVTTLFYKPN